MKKYAIYLRKSRADLDAEALGEMETLARHRRILTELARRQGLNVVKTYEEIVSGESIAERPQMIQLLDDIHDNLYDGVICMEIERLARGDSRDQGEVFEAFKYTNTLIITPSKTYNPNDPTDEEYFEFGLFMSRREYKTINRRLQRGRTQSVKEGNYIGSTPPFGYDKVRLDSHSGFTLTENNESKYVKMIFDWYVNDNLTPGQIAKRLTSIGVTPRKGDYWSTASVRDILRNPTYTGRLRWNWRKNQKEFRDGVLVTTRPRNDHKENSDYFLVDGKHPAIIDIETFEKAREREGTCSRANFKTHKANPLAGVVHCHCGRSIILQRYKKSADRLNCPNQPRCNTKSVLYSYFIDLLIDALKEHIGDAELKLEGDNNSDEINCEAILQTLRSEIAEAEKQRNKLYDLLEKGIYTTEVFVQRQSVLNSRIENLEVQLSELINNKPAKINYSDRISKLQEVIKILESESIDVDFANKFIKSVISDIVYDNVDGEVRLEVRLLV